MHFLSRRINYKRIECILILVFVYVLSNNLIHSDHTRSLGNNEKSREKTMDWSITLSNPVQVLSMLQTLQNIVLHFLLHILKYYIQKLA